MNDMELLWHQDKMLTVKNYWGSPVKSDTVLMCSHRWSHVELRGQTQLGEWTVRCGLQHPLYCWPLCSHFPPHTFMCMISVLAAFECRTNNELKLWLDHNLFHDLSPNHIHMPGLPDCPSCTDRAKNILPELLPLAGTSGVTVFWISRDTPCTWPA